MLFQMPSGCWVFLGRQSSNGYGRIYNRGKERAAHRVYYEMIVGPIPKDYELDHRCYNRLCCNPQHLEPVTRSENAKRRRTHGFNKRRLDI